MNASLEHMTVPTPPIHYCSKRWLKEKQTKNRQTKTDPATLAAIYCLAIK